MTKLRNGKTIEQPNQAPEKTRRSEEPTGDSEKSPMAGTDANASGTSATNGPPIATTTEPEERTSRFAIRKVVFSKPKEANKQDADNETPPPPIIVPTVGENKPAKQVLLTKIKQGDFIIKNLRNATQIWANNTATHSQIKALLTENQINYYSYSNDGPKLRKYVLYGLNSENIGDIKSDLHDYGLMPVDIKPMTIRKPRYDDHNNYLVYFDYEDKITLPMLQQAKYVCSTRISWAHYRAPADKCIQCQNCFKYNHNAKDCHLKPVCYLCAESHTAETCPLTKEKLAMKLSRIPEDRLKCINCNDHHTAVFKLCPSRVAYINKKKPKTTNNDNNQQPEQLYTPAPAPTVNVWNMDRQTPIPRATHYQPMKSNRLQVPADNRRMTETTTPTNHSQQTRRQPNNNYRQPPKRSTIQTAAPFKTADTIQPIYNKAEYTNNINLPYSDNPTKVNQIFSPQELMAIFQEMLGTISACRTKQDQLNALMTLTMKYLPCRE